MVSGGVRFVRVGGEYYEISEKVMMTLMVEQLVCDVCILILYTVLKQIYIYILICSHYLTNAKPAF